MTVISLTAEREARKPHWEGLCVCIGCRHEWRGVGLMGQCTDLECPSCSFPKGFTKHPFGPLQGDAEFQCNCGCEAITIYIRRKDRLKVFRCMACGTDLTEAVFL